MPTLRALRLLVVLAVTAAVSLGLVGPAAAGPSDKPRQPVRTTVEIALVGYEPNGTIVVQGNVSAARSACVTRRAVKLSATDTFGQTFEFRPSRAARSGAFRFELPSAGPIVLQSFTASVERLRTTGKRPVTCSAGSDTLSFIV